jgi:hypothetical protein
MQTEAPTFKGTGHRFFGFLKLEGVNPCVRGAGSATNAPGELNEAQTQRDTTYDSKLLCPGKSPTVCSGTNKRAAQVGDQTIVVYPAQSRSGTRNASVEDLRAGRPSSA